MRKAPPKQGEESSSEANNRRYYLDAGRLKRRMPGLCGGADVFQKLRLSFGGGDALTGTGEEVSTAGFIHDDLEDLAQPIWHHRATQKNRAVMDGGWRYLSSRK